MYKILPDGNFSNLSLNMYQIMNPIRNTKTNWYACKGEQVWSHKRIRNRILEIYPEIGDVKHLDVIEFLYQCEGEKRWIQNTILKEVSEGIASIIYSLRTENSSSQRTNNLTDADISFWKSCKNVFFVGGVAYGNMGIELEKYTNELLADNCCGEIEIKCIKEEKTEELALYGCASIVKTKNDRVYAFDFGNTAVKRGIVRIEKDKYRLDYLDIIVHEDTWSKDDSNDSAKELHEFIIKNILDIILLDKNYTYDTLCIGICLANNILSGSISNRGGYRYLRLLSDNYLDYLKEDLCRRTGKKCVVSMVNDTFAVAYMFRDWAPNSAVVTLGTYMGIAYPQLLV